MTDEFNLRALIREVAESSTTPDPVQLADEVARRIGPKQRAEALAQALPIVVRNVVSLTRSPITPDGHTRSERHDRPAARGSSKVAGIRDTWRRMLRDRIAVGPDQSDWKFLGECTVSDLEYAATIREEHARQNAARAVQFRELAERMQRNGVGTVADLPAHDLDDALGRAA
ncbi:hypothetical protein EV383_4482 [Pseudonocardia sediminis]|uniref:Uncharacterized protein n=1 Tax=Pseudonocardia sediminis TaxID=1397368 RepID=A0A4Q7UZH4_PSEST|nr:hypothetical protein [Pseudonocardia sediminis]RZT87557.1 hypothetical protein EV383_4482 [Pseudonocardia sediminis]